MTVNWNPLKAASDGTPAPRGIPPHLLDPLSLAIARAFDPATDLDSIMRRTTGDGLFEVHVAPGQTHRDTAYGLLVRIEALGIATVVLAEMLARRPDNARLRALIGEACPAALVALPTTQQKVGTVIAGLDATRQRLAKDAVRGALSTSREKLTSLADSIAVLKVYKSMHDRLHPLQLMQFRKLRSAARQLADDPAQRAELRDYHSQVRSICLGLRDDLRELPDDPEMEEIWLGRLERSVGGLQTALGDRDAAAAQLALQGIQQSLRSVPERLNQRILITANGLPLATLADALGQAADADDAAPEIRAAHDSMLAIMPSLRARVVEHGIWQEIDNNIADLEGLVDHPTANFLDEFMLYWLNVKKSLQALLAMDAGAEWVGKVEEYSNEVEDCLAKETIDDALAGAFHAYRREAQYRFLAVDFHLKSDCAALVGIGAPLQSILEEIRPKGDPK